MKRIFVGCMPFGFTRDEIRSLFEPFGKVANVQLFEDMENATFDAYAYVDMDTTDVSYIVDKLDGKRIGPRPLRINEYIERKDSTN